VIEELKETIQRLSAELKKLEQRDNDLINAMGYLHGDVVGALRSAHAGLKAALAPVGALPAEVTAGIEAIEAATNTLEVHTQP
jgi:hypothetical protein